MEQDTRDNQRKGGPPRALCLDPRQPPNQLWVAGSAPTPRCSGCAMPVKPLKPRRPRSGAWLSLVERLLWEQDVGGSNPLAPTNAAPVVRLERNRPISGLIMVEARIYRPAKTAMQSGRRQTRKWVLEYEPATSRLPEPLMGWTSAADTLNQVHLHFDTIAEAKAFAERQGLSYTIIEPHRISEKAKSYADNFRYDRVHD